MVSTTLRRTLTPLQTMGKGVRRTDYQMRSLPAADEAAVVCQRVPWGPIDYHLDARIWVAEWLQRGCLEASRRARGARFPCESVVDRRGVEPPDLRRAKA